MARQTNLTHHLFRRRARFSGRRARLLGRRARLLGRRARLLGRRARFSGRRARFSGRRARFSGRRRDGRWFRRTPPSAAAQPPGTALVSSYAAFGGCSTTGDSAGSSYARPTDKAAGFDVRRLRRLLNHRGQRWFRRPPPTAAAQPPGTALVSSYATFGGCSTTGDSAGFDVRRLRRLLNPPVRAQPAGCSNSAINCSTCTRI